MEKVVRTAFIPYCYRSMALKPLRHKGDNAAGQPTTGCEGQGNNNPLDGPVDVEVVYNICNKALDEEDFAEALAACPMVLDLFTEQMRSVLYQQNRQTQEEGERTRRKAADTVKRFNFVKRTDLEGAEASEERL